MPDKTNNNGYDVPSIDETASSQSTPSEGQKSPISMITEEVKAAGLQIKPTIDNFLMLIAKHYSDHLRLNEMTGKPEYRWKGIWYEWTDTQESKMKAYFQNNYNVYSTKMLEDAIRIHFDYNKVNPLLDILEKLEWDGKPRVEHFLHDIMKADDNEYTRECSRLIFAGGIHRALRPGCKFDDMIVLIGGQGAGKSTIVRWLNIDDQFYQEIKTITGKEGIEALRGVWIGEVSELMAMTRAKEVEAVKAYVTSQKDNYRPPYEKNVRTIPRRCIFIGTTNNPQFLTDKTGNRRFYPVKVNSSASKIYKNETIIREYIRQAWAEALQLFLENKLPPFPNINVLEQIQAAQKDAMEDDWRIGAIEQYLADTKKLPNSTVSVIELWHCALNQSEEIKPSRKDSIEITQIIANIPGWIRSDRQICTKWGKQKAFIKSNPYFPAWR